ncbi:MAG: MarC family protein [Dehalococcoidia bacterium]|nr:MarC family protein [Dehalococcoidia bacterium]
MDGDFARALVGFFAIVDPIGAILPFQAVAGAAPLRRRLGIALMAVLVSFALISLFAVAGQDVLDLLDISPESFQIAAGVLLVLPAIRLVERGEVFEANPYAGPTSFDAAVVPLALPMLSGPGALALATSTSETIGAGQTIAAAGMIFALVLAVFAAAAVFFRFIHPAVLRAAARIVGVVLMAIAVDFIVSGWVAATA